MQVKGGRRNGRRQPDAAAREGGCHAIVLAGGRGRRLAELTRQIEGQSTPKQYASYGCGASLLQRTIGRLFDLHLVRRTHVVIDAAHASFAARQLAPCDWLRVVAQPTDRGTAAGVMFPLADVLAEDPDATVLLTPADHAVGDQDVYRRGVFEAVRAIAGGVADVVLLGVEADAPRTDYGWIVPDRPLRGGVREMAGLVEKPAADVAVRLHRAGALWNTRVLVARARALWDLVCSTVPALGVVFGAARALAEPTRAAFLKHRYERMASHDFSHDVLGGAQGLAVLAWPRSMGWSNLGTPDRLRAWLGQASASPRHANSVLGAD